MTGIGGKLCTKNATHRPYLYIAVQIRDLAIKMEKDHARRE